MVSLFENALIFIESLNLEFLTIITLSLFFFLFLNSINYNKHKNKELYENNSKVIIGLYIIGLIIVFLGAKNATYIAAVGIILFLINSKEAIQNILAGFFIKSKINTAIKVGELVKTDKSKTFKKVLKVNLFKTYLLDIKTKEIVSIQNKELNELETIHNIFSKMNIIEVSVFCTANKLEYLSFIESELNEIIKSDKIDFQYLKEIIKDTKRKYNYFTDYKPKYNIIINEKEMGTEFNIKLNVFQDINEIELYKKIHIERFNQLKLLK